MANKSVKRCVMQWVQNMDECELITLISLVSCSISKCCSTDEISLLAVVFTQLGDTLATILTKRELNEKCTNTDTDKKSDCSDFTTDNDNDSC